MATPFPFQLSVNKVTTNPFLPRSQEEGAHCLLSVTLWEYFRFFHWAVPFQRPILCLFPSYLLECSFTFLSELSARLLAGLFTPTVIIMLWNSSTRISDSDPANTADPWAIQVWTGWVHFYVDFIFFNKCTVGSLYPRCRTHGFNQLWIENPIFFLFLKINFIHWF